MKTFLFQGDSITDAGRNREEEYNLGPGYPNLVAAQMSYDHPGEFQFINKGISGDRSVSVYNRLHTDIINLAPDYMSILIGVNDIWHALSGNNGVTPERYEQFLSMLFEDITEKLPDIKIIVLEPFVLKGPATEGNWEAFDSGVRKVAEIAKAVADKFSLKFVPLQDKFDSLCLKAPASCWLADGVHPTIAGHKVIANALIDAIEI